MRCELCGVKKQLGFPYRMLIIVWTRFYFKITADKFDHMMSRGQNSDSSAKRVGV